MPPKKQGTPKATRRNSVFTKRGREIKTTAAAARPKRESAMAPTTPAAATKKRSLSTSAKATASKPARKRGRPAMTVPATNEAPRKRGRPAKNVTKPAAAEEVPPPKKRGRPSRSTAAEIEDETNVDEEEQAPPKKRGRPSKFKATTIAPAVPEEETAPPKRRGRPPKGGETTRLDVDDEAAADQLDEELQETAQQDKAAGDGKRYWLMKSEQEGHDIKLKSGEVYNTAFTIDDLRSKTEPEAWDGVRNPTAAKNMRAMKNGDLAFFYASGGKSGRKPGIVGIMEIVREAEPDQTAYDEEGYAYVAKEGDRGKWCVVHVEFRKKLNVPVFLSELQKFSKQGGMLSNMQEFKAARLSVSQVSEAEWNFIVNNLIEGYDDDDSAAAASGSTSLPKDSGALDSIEDAAGPLPKAGSTAMEEKPNTSGGTVLRSSGPVSRATSRKPSVKPSGSRAGSRTLSLAPSAAGTHQRSSTPKPHTGSVAPTAQPTAMDPVVEEDAQLIRDT